MTRYTREELENRSKRALRLFGIMMGLLAVTGLAVTFFNPKEEGVFAKTLLFIIVIAGAAFTPKLVFLYKKRKGAADADSINRQFRMLGLESETTGVHFEDDFLIGPSNVHGIKVAIKATYQERNIYALYSECRDSVNLFIYFKYPMAYGLTWAQKGDFPEKQDLLQRKLESPIPEMLAWASRPKKARDLVTNPMILERVNAAIRAVKLADGHGLAITDQLVRLKVHSIDSISEVLLDPLVSLVIEIDTLNASEEA